MGDESTLRHLESEAIYIFREVVAGFKKPVLLYSVGKDSSVLLRLAQKAFHPSPIPFPLLHVDTGYKFPEMIEFRDARCRELGATLIVEKNTEKLESGCHPDRLGMEKCCFHLKTTPLLNAIAKHGFDAAIGGARREEEKSRAKERVFSVRDGFGQWEPKSQRPELWRLYNTHLAPRQSMRVFPLSNWTEEDIWSYIELESIPVVPLYFAHERDVFEKNGVWLSPSEGRETIPTVKRRMRYRSLGCTHCTGSIPSEASTLSEILAEVKAARKSERENRTIDLTGESSMEDKKREGYF